MLIAGWHLYGSRGLWWCWQPDKQHSTHPAAPASAAAASAVMPRQRDTPHSSITKRPLCQPFAIACVMQPFPLPVARLCFLSTFSRVWRQRSAIWRVNWRWAYLYVAEVKPGLQLNVVKRVETEDSSSQNEVRPITKETNTFFLLYFVFESWCI